MNNTILIVSSIGAFFLLMWSPNFGSSVAFLIIAVLLFRGINLLTDIQKRLAQITTDPEIENQEKAEVNQKA